jgi:hypothetical protein
MTRRPLALVVLPLLLALSPAAAAQTPPPPPAPPPPPRWESAPPPAARPDPCADRLTEDVQLDRALAALTFTAAGKPRPLAGVTISGLRTLDAGAVWDLLGGQPAPVGAVRAAQLVRRLVASGLFAKVIPVVHVDTDPGPTLEIVVVEHPVVRRVIFEGLSETRPTVLLEALLEVPTAPRGKRRQPPGPCPEPAAVPPSSWLAHAEGPAVRPGLLWRGVVPALERVLGRLLDRGYLLASLDAALSPDGSLTVRVNEGRLGALRIEGVAPAIEPRVRDLLDLRPGQVFVEHELGAALGRVHARLPFLHLHVSERATREALHVVEESAPGGERHYRTIEGPAPIDRDEPTGTPGDERRLRLRRKGGVVVEGDRVTLHFRAERFMAFLHGPEPIRHTPVTGFAPGLEGFGQFWDPQDRVHLRLDLLGNVNTKAARGPDRRERFDWLVGPRVSIPALHIVELGAQAYSRVDTADRWRLSRLDSYLYSLVFNRPDSDYFHRRGTTAFATVEVVRALLLGAEYRRDTYASLRSARDVFTLFNRDERPRATPAITDGRIGSCLLRLEWSTTPASPIATGNLLRDPERPLQVHDSPFADGLAAWTTFRTVNTVEIARPGMGGDARFVRVVSDSAAFVRTTGPRRGVKVRARVAGRVDGALPLQRQEALGGWTALRGYGFKELGPGTFSWLTTVEYRLSALSAFVDAGAVRVDGAAPPKVGLGVALNLGDQAHVDLAWRADDRARAVPEVRLLFQRVF